MGPTQNVFSVWDYVVFGSMLLISAGIGIYYGCTGSKQKSASEFLLAGRDMHFVPVALSLLASFMSAITLLGVPSDMYVFGVGYVVICIAFIFMIPTAAYIYHPVFYNLNMTSIFEYLEYRFKSKALRKSVCVIYIIQSVMYMAIVLYAPALALNAVTGFNIWAAVLSVGLVCIFYTSLGGMKAVMWTDTFQVGLMFLGMIVVLIKGAVDFNGFTNIWNIAEEGQRLEFPSFNPSPTIRHSFWSLTVGGFFTWLAIYGVNQSQVQRVLTCPTLKKAQLSMLINIPGLAAIIMLTAMCGFVVYAHFKDCDPLTTGVIQGRDQILPLYVMQAMGNLPGIPGIFTACIFSGTLSTISSGLNSLSAVTTEDFILDMECFKIHKSRTATVSKIIGVFFGVIMICLAYVASFLGGVLQAALAIFGVLGGPILGVFTLGLFFPMANKKGAFVGLVLALIIQIWIAVGANITKPYVPRPPMSIQGCMADNSSIIFDHLNLTDSIYTYQEINTTETSVTEGIDLNNRPAFEELYSISYLWYSFYSVFIVCVVGLLTSFITGPLCPSEVDPRTISPIVLAVCCCLSQEWQDKMGCEGSVEVVGVRCQDSKCKDSGYIYDTVRTTNIK